MRLSNETEGDWSQLENPLVRCRGLFPAFAQWKGFLVRVDVSPLARRQAKMGLEEEVFRIGKQLEKIAGKDAVVSIG